MCETSFISSQWNVTLEATKLSNFEFFENLYELYKLSYQIASQKRTFGKYSLGFPTPSFSSVEHNSHNSVCQRGFPYSTFLNPNICPLPICIAPSKIYPERTRKSAFSLIDTELFFFVILRCIRSNSLLNFSDLSMMIPSSVTCVLHQLLAMIDEGHSSL